MTVICANNSIYGMTGGQVSPTTPKDAKTMTTSKGNPEEPFDLCRLTVACGARYVARYTVFHIKPLINSIKKALTTNGLSFIDVVSPCPTQFGRRNKQPTLYEMLTDLKTRSVRYETVKSLKKDDLIGKVVIGEFNE
jgi:2-oxoglutarate ferredoxin oxidoreductase subunit beta